MELIRIIKDKNLDLQTRIDAVGRLNEDEIEIDDLDEDIQLFIVENSNNQFILGFFVINSEFEYVHYCAMDKIYDENVLMDIALNSLSTYSDNIKFMRVSSTLFPAYYNGEKAFSKIEDKSKLIKIVKDIGHILFNVDYIKGFINDDNDWADIAINGHYGYHRIFAMNQIKNEELFCETLIKTDSEDLIKTAEYFGDNSFLKKIKKIDDEKYFKHVVLNHSDSSTRIDAIRRIADEHFLKSIVLSDANESLRINALKNIHDEDFLKDIALNNEISSIRGNACENIHDEDFLKRMALNDDESVRAYAVSNICDEDFLKKIALNDDDEFVRQCAIDNIFDEDFLKRIALSDEEIFIRVRIIEKMVNKDFLKDIALNGDVASVCCNACLKCGDTSLFREFDFSNCPSDLLNETILENIDDENVVYLIRYADKDDLEMIFENIGDMKIYHDALLCRFKDVKYHTSNVIAKYFKNMDDEDKLKEIFLNNDLDQRFRLSAFEGINDDEFPKNVFLDERNDEWSRCDVLLTIDDEDFLKDVALKDSNDEFRKFATMGIYDEVILKEIFLNSIDWFIKSIAVSKIHDQDFLKDIIANDDMKRNGYMEKHEKYPPTSYLSFRQKAIGNIHDMEFCMDYAFNDEDEDVRKAASENIGDENILKQLFLNESSSNVRNAIMQRIEDDSFFADIVCGDYDGDIKSDAFHAIGGEENHIKIAYDFNEFSIDSINYINDKKALRSIAEMKTTSKSDEEIVEAAKNRICRLFFKSEAHVFYSY